jgi:hypothetical protein
MSMQAQAQAQHYCQPPHSQSRRRCHNCCCWNHCQHTRLLLGACRSRGNREHRQAEAPLHVLHPIRPAMPLRLQSPRPTYYSCTDSPWILILPCLREPPGHGSKLLPPEFGPETDGLSAPPTFSLRKPPTGTLRVSAFATHGFPRGPPHFVGGVTLDKPPSSH